MYLGCVDGLWRTDDEIASVANRRAPKSAMNGSFRRERIVVMKINFIIGPTPVARGCGSQKQSEEAESAKGLPTVAHVHH